LFGVSSRLWLGASRKHSSASGRTTTNNRLAESDYSAHIAQPVFKRIEAAYQRARELGLLYMPIAKVHVIARFGAALP
jgi:hypothetical protein